MYDRFFLNNFPHSRTQLHKLSAQTENKHPIWEIECHCSCTFYVHDFCEGTVNEKIYFLYLETKSLSISKLKKGKSFQGHTWSCWRWGSLRIIRKINRNLLCSVWEWLEKLLNIDLTLKEIYDLDGNVPEVNHDFLKFLNSWQSGLCGFEGCIARS